MNERQATGRIGYLAGMAAEEIVALDYARRGMRVVGRRWRGRGGEIDLIARKDDGLVFIEVKKSSSFAGAAMRLNPRQIARISATAAEYLAGEPRAMDTDARFDVALVDKRGAVSVIENAFMAA